MKKLIFKIWNYFAPSWEGDDGKASSRKLTLLAITSIFLPFTFFVHDEITLKVYGILFSGVLISIFNLTWSKYATLIKFTLPALGKSPDNSPPNEELPKEFVQDVIAKNTGMSEPEKAEAE